HPELAEYIWGDRTDQYWTAAGTSEPEITLPVAGSTIDLGVSAAGVEVSKTVNIRTVAATQSVTLSATAPFKVATSSVTAAQANAGTTVTVSYIPAAVGTHTGTFTVATGKTSATYTLTGRCVAGVPAAEATYVTDDSFVANWTYIGDADSQGRYTLTVSDDEGVLDGYPRTVDAKTGHYTVDGLTPQTDYYYTVASNTLVSSTIAVTTGAPIPSIDFLFDGDLFFTAIPGEASEVAELLMDVANIDTDITVTVEAPFQISLDRTDWTTSLRMSPDEDRLYMRLLSDVAGTYETSIVATAGDYFTDNAEVSGEVSAMQTFFEDFEKYEKKYETYNDQTYQGTACTWNLKDAGMWASDNDAHSGEHSIRLGKTPSSTIEMTADRHKGIGTISFYAIKWTDKEADTEVAVETSIDGGNTWQLAGKVTVDNASTWTEYHVAANVAGTARMRLRQTVGARFFVDDIGLTDRTSGVDDPAAERHQWDAYSHGGDVIVTVSAPAGIEAAVYSVDGTTIYAGHLSSGTHTFDTLAPGTIVIVHSGDFSRTLLVR
ncbi:MAG: hypothetical protein K2M55_07825, partial [Muribaculaceae bacterium]|nr:hypothetical protein [Muribaculaceae bacterium]